MIYRRKHPTIKCHILGILQGFAEIADGLVTICSLGFYGSGFETKVAFYRSKSYFQEMTNARSNNVKASPKS